jgi:1-phosphofructokinase
VIYTVTLNTAIDHIINIDGKLTRRRNNKIKHQSVDIGGKATHVSVVLSKLKIPNTAMGFVGSKNSQVLIDLLKKAGVTCDFIEQQGCATREVLVILDDSDKGSVMITSPGFEITPHSIQKIIEKLKNSVLQDDIVVFAGSPPRGIEVESYLEILKAAAQSGGKLVVDTSGEFLRAAVRLKPLMIKPNEYEFQELVGKKLHSINEYLIEMKKLLHSGIEYVIVSLGKKGSLIGYKDNIYRVVPPEVREVNDTGCGDVFLGGLIAGLYRNHGLEQAARFATALSASKAAQCGSSTFALEMAKTLEDAVIFSQVEV